MNEELKAILDNEYGIQSLSMQEVPAGWSASAWKVHSGYGDFFLKVFDKQKPSTKGWVARIDSYIPVTLWLYENADLRDRLVAPILTKGGFYKHEDENHLYMVYPYIDGQTVGSEKLTLKQVKEIASIIAKLHSYGAEIPVPTDLLRENFDVSFCSALNHWIEDKNCPELSKALAPYTNAILHATAILQDRAALMQKSDLRFALCHTDIHGWNLMQSNNLVLIDWEGLKLAPVEADLFSFTDTFFFDYAWDDFSADYRSVHKEYQVNPEAMRFYRMRRRLEDIHAFAGSILQDDLTPAETERSLYYLKQECALLDRT